MEPDPAKIDFERQRMEDQMQRQYENRRKSCLRLDCFDGLVPCSELDLCHRIININDRMLDENAHKDFYGLVERLHYLITQWLENYDGMGSHVNCPDCH